MKTVIVAVLAGLFLSACTTSPTGRHQLMLVSPESAIVQSKQAYLTTVNDLDAKNQLVSDPATVKRVHDITGRLITEAIEKYPASADWEWSVAIIDDPGTVNAWCMAGGRMAVYTGLFEQLKLTDDEFAQIMGHEISHALANHTAEKMSVAMASSIGVLAVGLSSDRPGATLTGAALAASLAVELPNSRKAESEADEIGLELATRAGYDPEAAVTLWQKMAKVGGGAPPQFLSTHPSPGNREARLAEMIPDVAPLNPDRKLAAIHPVEIVK